MRRSAESLETRSLKTRSSKTRSSRLLVGALLVGCGSGCGSDPSTGTTDDPTTDTDPGSTVAQGDTSTGEDPEPQTADATTMPPTTQTPTTVPLPMCGDGVREAPEQCDDGNLEPGDGCEPDCTSSVDTELWTQTHGGDAAVQDVGYDVAFDEAGNVYVVGFEVDLLGDANVWLQSYDPAGEPGLSVTLDPSSGGDDRGVGIALSPGGDIFLSGRTASVDGTDAWAARLTAAGETVWQVTASGVNPGANEASAIAVGPSGDVFVGGYLRVGNGDNDAWVARLAADTGATVWEDMVAGPDGLDDRIGGVEVDSEGTLVVAGYLSNAGFNADVWLRSYDADGTELWTTQYDSVLSGDEKGFDVALAPDGTVGVAATTPGAGSRDDIWLGTFDLDAGELLTQKMFGGPAVLADQGLALAADSTGAFVVVGFKGVAEANTDIWIRKWDAGGNVAWTQNLAGAGAKNDVAWGVGVDADDNIVVTGEIRQQRNNDADIWVAKYAPE